VLWENDIQVQNDLVPDIRNERPMHLSKMLRESVQPHATKPVP